MKAKLSLLVLLISVLFSGCGKDDGESVSFTYTKGCIGGTPCTVEFKNLSSGNANYKWDFGDNTPYSNERNPTHTYASGSKFTVVLTAQYGNLNKEYSLTIDFTSIGDCQTKGSFKCAKELHSGFMAEDMMDSTQNSYYFFTIDSAGAISVTLDAVPGLPSERSYTISLLNEPKTSGSAIISKSGYGGETITFYAGPLPKKEYYLRVQESANALNKTKYKIGYSNIRSDINEVNDAFSSATALEFGQGKQGTILAKGDKDYFRLNVSSYSVVDVLITPVPNFGAGQRLNASIYQNANSNTLIREEYGVSGETIKFPIGPLTPGDYYIVLSSYYESADQYNILATLDTSDKYEINNTFITAKQMSVGVQVTGTIKAKGDEDYYKFIATKNGAATFSIPKVPNRLSSLYVNLYSDANSNSYMGSTYAYGDQPLLFTPTQALQIGKTYYVRLAGGSSSDESDEIYKLTINQ